MIYKIDKHITQLEHMKQYPKQLFGIGDISLLERNMISIVGTRKPISYTKMWTNSIANRLKDIGITVVSGAAMGVDSIAHSAAGYDNTIAVVANGLDIRYPSVNKHLIKHIEEQGVVISSYEIGQKATKYSFVHRNEIVVALGDALIITQADEKSGSLRSAEFAKSMGKPIFVLPHRLGDSKGTDNLLKNGEATAIYDIDDMIEKLGFENRIQEINDELIKFCKKEQNYEICVSKFGNKIFEYELLGKIKVQNGKVFVV
ncbi:MAG: DNA processing protein DprA [Campylobacteraceae bacterium 4484_166]|nr:MAG: DNA processing protein DprA [Campylobacteraceae bacterium 4484_166]